MGTQERTYRIQDLLKPRFKKERLKKLIKEKYEEAKALYAKGQTLIEYQGVKRFGDYDILLNEKEGDIMFYKAGTSEFDRKNGPALINKKRLIWLKDGIIHREKKPAFISEKGIRFYKNGKLHRQNGPALIQEDAIVFSQEGNPYFPKSILSQINKKFFIKIFKSLLNNKHYKHTEKYIMMFNIKDLI